MIRAILRWLGLADNEDTSDFIEDTIEDVFATSLDKGAPNLFLGKIINDGSIKCEVVDVHTTNIHVKILEIKWDRLGTYLDVGKVYPVFKHSSEYLGDDMQIWEISSKRMKRDTSQVLLYWEKDIGWTWDLDC
jgi:hypothetical protein